MVGQVIGGLAGALVIFVIANSIGGFDAKASGFASNGFGDHSPGGFDLAPVIITEVVFTALFVFVVFPIVGGALGALLWNALVPADDA